MIDWKIWYEIFDKLIEIYFPDSDKIQDGVNTLYNWFSQDQNFMLAYNKWIQHEEGQ